MNTIYLTKKILIIITLTFAITFHFLFSNSYTSNSFYSQLVIENGSEPSQYNPVENLDHAVVNLNSTAYIAFRPHIEKGDKSFVNITSVKPTGENDSAEDFVFYEPNILEESFQLMDKKSELYQFIEEQKKRRGIVAKVCNSSDTKIKKELNIETEIRHIMIDRKTHLTFCPVYKAASTTWATYILKFNGFWEKAYKNYPNYEDIQAKINMFYNRSSNDLVPKLSQGTTKFMEVRHPIDRLVSCYRDKFEGASQKYYYVEYGESMITNFRKSLSGLNKTQKASMMKAVNVFMAPSPKSKIKPSLKDNPYANPLGPTFREFLQYVLTNIYLNVHWMPSYSLCSVCRIEYDFYLKFEDHGRDSQLFFKYLKQDSRLEIVHENFSKGFFSVSEVVCTYLSTVSRSIFDNIIKEYVVEYMLYGYDINKYSNCTLKDDNKE